MTTHRIFTMLVAVLGTFMTTVGAFIWGQAVEERRWIAAATTATGVWGKGEVSPVSPYAFWKVPDRLTAPMVRAGGRDFMVIHDPWKNGNAMNTDRGIVIQDDPREFSQ